MDERRTSLWLLIKGMNDAPAYSLRENGVRYGFPLLVIAAVLVFISEATAALYFAALGAAILLLALVLQWRAERNGRAARERQLIAEAREARGNDPMSWSQRIGYVALVIGWAALVVVARWLSST